MKSNRIFLAIISITAAVGLMMYSAISNTKKAVVTVNDLVSAKSKQQNVRVGARVLDGNFEYRTTPEFFLKFKVRDIVTPDKFFEVHYNASMPDTLKAGRDVILEGDFDGNIFYAKSLLTQCPSKYEPPIPGKY